jgi:hypothetical protein
MVQHVRLVSAVALAIVAGLSGFGCGGSSQAPDTTQPVASVRCDRAGTTCPTIAIAGDPPSATSTWQGYADASVLSDPRGGARFWMGYTYLEGKLATSAGGQSVGVPHTSTRLAESTDGGRTWSRTAVLWDGPLATDPEGLGPASYSGSETPSIVAATEGSTVRWYGARLSYFLEPVSAYQPRYASSWTIRVSTATGDTPAVLAGAPEAVLGTATTATAYGVTARLTNLSSQLAGCGIWNNPSLALDGGRLFVLTECVEFDAQQVSDARSRVVVFSTVPSGSPASWVWRYDGVLADRGTATELGAARLVSANVSRTEQGKWMLMFSLHSGSGVVNQGCTGVELASLAPPALVRTNGALNVLARVTNESDPNWYTGSCGHASGSATGIVAAAAVNSNGLQTDLRATRLMP